MINLGHWQQLVSSVVDPKLLHNGKPFEASPGTFDTMTFWQVLALLIGHVVARPGARVKMEDANCEALFSAVLSHTPSKFIRNVFVLGSLALRNSCACETCLSGLLWSCVRLPQDWARRTTVLDCRRMRHKIRSLTFFFEVGG